MLGLGSGDSAGSFGTPFWSGRHHVALEVVKEELRGGPDLPDRLLVRAGGKDDDDAL